MSWLEDFYKQNNIGGAGGVLDKTAKEYWEKEAATKGIDSIKNIIKGTAKAEGTWNKTPTLPTPKVTIKPSVTTNVAPPMGPLPQPKPKSKPKSKPKPKSAPVNQVTINPLIAPRPNTATGQVPNNEITSEVISDFYVDNNIGGVGGDLSPEAEEYWAKEAKEQEWSVDQMKDVIKGTAEAEGTWNQVLPANTAETPPAEYELPIPGTTIKPYSGQDPNPTVGPSPEPEITTEPETMNDSNWLKDYYAENNIGGVGGNLSPDAEKYWMDEAIEQGWTADQTRDVIKGTAKAEGSWNQVPDANTSDTPPVDTPPAETPPVNTPPVNTPAANTNAIAGEEVSGYLQGLYNSAFGRDAGQEGLDYWGNAIQQGKHGDRDWREWLASSIYKSDEYTGGNTAAPPTDPPTAPPTDTNTDSSAMGMDKFMQFMMFMNMMRPQGGFGGGSQYGYGGLNPGGVQSAYSPMDDFGNYMNNFKSLSSGLIN